MSNYYSSEFHFPNSHPFDRLEYRWQSFVGEFIRPIAEQYPDLLYCSTYYGPHAEFYAYSNDLSILQPRIAWAEQRGFKIVDLHRTLEGNFAIPRFFGPHSQSNKTRRATLIFKSLKAVCDLLIDSVYKREDGYWDFEGNADKTQNPIGNHFFSVTHLYHIITQANVLIYSLQAPDGNVIPVPYYTYLNNFNMFRAYRLMSSPHQCLP